MRVGLLGPVVVETDGDTREVRGARQQGLLALLALHAGTVVSNGRIVDELWGDDAPANPTNALQAVVSRVRKVIGADALVAQSAGYLLDVAPEDIDAVRFERLLTEGRNQLDAGDPSGATSATQQALELWRGPVLEGLGDLPFARAAAVRLGELRGAALDTWADAQLALGRHDTLIADLRRAVEQDPMREGTWSRLMLALYRAGRQADALRAYQEARSALADQLGVEPGPELRAMEARVLAQSADLDAPARSSAPAAHPPPVDPPALRRPRTSFVGRADELEELEQAIAGAPMVTLLGPGGVGKTRLASELAARHVDAGERVVFVDLAPMVVEDDVAETFAMALGGRDQSAFTGASLDALSRIAAQTAGGRLLLVVDNCEHVVGAAAHVVDTIVGAGTQVRVVATSREALGVPGEHVHPLPPLADDDCVRLFVDRATSTNPGFAPTADDEATVAEICRRLDGLPLAVELAAARTRSLSVGEIARRLDDRFRLLTGGARTAEPRQQTLRAVVEWSHDLLDEEERHVLARLSAFVDGFTLDDAAAVVGGDKVDAADVPETVLRLADKSLVTADPARGRFGMLQTLWDFAREQLVAAGEAGLVLERHAHHFADLAVVLEPDLRSAGQRRALDRLEDDHDNLRAALEWAVAAQDRELGARLVSAIGWFWYVRGYVAEGSRWASTMTALDGELRPDLESRLLRNTALLGMFAGRGDLPPVERAIELARQGGDPRQIAETLIIAAALYPRQGDLDIAVARLEEAAAAAPTDLWVQGTVAMLQAGLLGGTLDEPAKRLRATEAIERFRAEGDDWGLSMSLMTRALSLEAHGAYDDALADYAEAHGAAERLGSLELGQHFRIHSGNLHTLAGDPHGARRNHEEAIAAARRTGSTGPLGLALNGLGIAARRLGDLDAARDAHAEARDLYLSGEWFAGAALALAGLGFVAEEMGHADVARRHHLESLDVARRIKDDRSVALACEGLAGAAALAGEHDAAARLLGHADGLRTSVGAPLPPAERTDVDRIEASVIGAIGRERYEALAAEGAGADVDALLSR